MQHKKEQGEWLRLRAPEVPWQKNETMLPLIYVVTIDLFVRVIVKVGKEQFKEFFLVVTKVRRRLQKRQDDKHIQDGYLK